MKSNHADRQVQDDRGIQEVEQFWIDKRQEDKNGGENQVVAHRVKAKNQIFRKIELAAPEEKPGKKGIGENQHKSDCVYVPRQPSAGMLTANFLIRRLWHIEGFILIVNGIKAGQRADQQKNTEGDHKKLNRAIIAHPLSANIGSGHLPRSPHQPGKSLKKRSIPG